MELISPDEMVVDRGEWKNIRFETLYSVPSRNGVSASQNIQGIECGVVNMGEMFGFEFISKQEMKHIMLKEADVELNSLRDGDLLFGRRSIVEAGAGKCSLVVQPPEKLVFESSIIRVRLNTESVSPRYYYYFFHSTHGRACIRPIVCGTNVKGIRGSDLKRLFVPLPSMPEQCAIAEAMSDVDALMVALDKFIVKKRDLKTAVMQQLLTGQIRLPGFHGKWEVKRLGAVCHITTGKKDVNEGNPSGQYPFFTCAKSNTFSDSYSFDGEAILIAGNGEVGNLSYCNGKFEAYQRTYVLQDFTTNVSYLWQQLSAYLASSLGIGKIGSSIPYIKMGNLVGFEFRSPIDETEQNAIAEVLSDMDAELAVLEQRLAKTRDLKQGMMQELLTGRTRLV